MATLRIRGSKMTPTQEHEIAPISGYTPTSYALHDPARFAFRLDERSTKALADLLSTSFETREPGEWMHYGMFANTGTACWGSCIMHEGRMYDGIKIVAYEDGQYVLSAAPAAA